MSHYDCDNCGAYGGIDWGYCEECTPKEYLDAKKRIQDETKRLYDVWDDNNHPFRSMWVSGQLPIRCKDDLAIINRYNLARSQEEKDYGTLK